MRGLLLMVLSLFLIPATAGAETRELPKEISQEQWVSAKKELKLSTGLEMKYIEMGQPGGETLILLHGMTDNSRSWSLIAASFAGKHHLIIPDQRGHGDSGKPDTRMYLPSDYAADLAALMTAKGIKKAHLVGHSLGSMTAQTFAVNYPEKTGKVVLVASAPVEFASLGRDLYDAAVAFGENQPDDAFMAAWYENPNPVSEDFLKREMKESQNIPPYAWRAITKGAASFDLSPFMNELKLPTLILWGELDGFFGQESQAALRKAIPQAEFILYENTGHNIQWEQPEKMAADINAFLAKP